MKRVPRSREVDQAIGAVVRELKLALEDLNQQAAALLARGDYDGASAMMRTGELLSEFQNRVAALQGEWRALRGALKAEKRPKEETTPLWKYYQPIAKALVAAGGRAKRRDLEQAVESLLQSLFVPGDLVPNVRGEPRWQVMVRRARRPMRDEGFLDDTKGSWWCLSAEGRKLAKKGDVEAAGE